MTSRTPKRKNGRGTLHIIAGLLVASAALRLGSGGTELVAEIASEEIAVQPEIPRQVPTATAEMAPMLDAFRAREERLSARENQLADRMQVLRLAEEEIQEKLTALTQAEEALRATLALADTAAESDLARLATVYENMKPKDAASLFTEMTPEFAAGFLGLMRPEVAAAIMSELESPVAYSISVMLAGRNASVPTE